MAHELLKCHTLIVKDYDAWFILSAMIELMETVTREYYESICLGEAYAQ